MATNKELDFILEELAKKKNVKFFNGFYFVTTKSGELQIYNFNQVYALISHKFELYKQNQILEVIKCIEALNQMDKFEGQRILIERLNAKAKAYTDKHKADDIPFLIKDLEAAHGGELLKLLAPFFLGYTPHFLVIKGSAGAGKSMILKYIQLIYDELFNNLTMSDIGKPFGLADAVGYQYIVGDDMTRSDGFGENAGKVKTLITGGTVPAARKFLSSVPLTGCGNFIFATNNTPIIDYVDDGYQRRTCYVELNNKIKLTLDYDRYFTSGQIAAFLTYMQKIVNLEEFERLRQCNYLKLVKNTPAYRAITYNDYLDLCKTDGFKPMNKLNFNEFCKIFKRED